ncbi:glycosyltransferase family 4 protein [Flavobacterium facile]|uniref:glycosyltransferase family 4 protein n=1 Tax=Flavobacterium facile TaxID=2893174 RepID=UPI002E79067B|nr:glycosyltransferase family 4 protein [Flavobacterium sp. T-12]
MKILRIFKLFITILPKLKKQEIYFFFPFYHLGGAETVHNDILEVFSKKDSVCFITNKSVNKFNKANFEKSTVLLEINKIIRSRFLKKIALKKISSKINATNNPIVFGCNSEFFYELIPYLDEKVKVIDLIHAFSYEENSAAEKVSLKVVERINKRVVLGEKTKTDFKELYLKENKNLALLERIKIIKNKVNVPEVKIIKDFLSPMVILFVARDSYEKRPELFFEIAKKSYEINPDIKFKVIGDNFENHEISPNVEIIGPIQEKNIINTYYKEADLILITSSREGFPMVILEGMSYGVVPISTNVGEISTFINDKNQNGFLIDNHTDKQQIVADFLESIQYINKNRNTLEKYSLNAYNSVKQEFSSETNKENYLNLFFN